MQTYGNPNHCRICILDTLNKIGVTYSQGYAISKPLRLQELLDPNHRTVGLDDTNVA